MKRNIWAIALAVIVNCILVFIMLYNHAPNKQSHPYKKPVIEVNLKQPHPNQQDRGVAWLHKHYGKAINVEHAFSVSKHLKGYVVSLKSNPDERSIIYSVNNGSYYLIGTVLDKKGRNLSLTNSEHYIQGTMNKAIFEAAKNLKGIKQGSKTAPQITIIIDPNSNAFPAQWNGLIYDIEQGIFSVKWVLVNYLKPMGPNVAGDILQSNNPIAAMNNNAANYDKMTQTGGYVKHLTLQPNTKKILIKNWNFVQKFNLYQLPVTILKNNAHYYVIKGVVMDEALEGIFSDSAHEAKS